MPRKKSHIEFTDQFCGAGGSSEGVKRLARRLGGGIELKLALNHWQLAIDTHNTNHPEAIHECTDISACDPRRYPSTDILITSPECTNHSPGKGKKVLQKQMDLFKKGLLDPAAERSRATMWDVVRFAEYHRYNAIIVENVVEARKWIPFESWLHAMRSLGYNHKCVYLNSMHFHPTPQSRDRMYIVFWKKGNRPPDLEYMPWAYCPRCEKNVESVQTWKKPQVRCGKYDQQYVYCCPACAMVVRPYYYASFNCIDWTDIGEPIGEREKPLSPNTIRRIEVGRKKYADHPFQVVNYTPGTAKSIADPFSSITTIDHHGIFTPFIVKLEHNYSAAPVDKPLKTQTSRQSDMLVTSYTRPIIGPLFTQTTCQGTGFVTPPFLTVMRNNSNAIAITDPLNGISAGGIHTGIVTTDSWNSFMASYNNGSHCLKHVTEEMGTLVATDRHALINYKTPAIEECYYRMLKAMEVKLGMAFEKSYVVLGNSRDQVRQCGNAVTPPVMEFLSERVVKSLS